MVDIFVPEGIGVEYKYLVPSNYGYYDLYNTNDLRDGEVYSYYRIYYGINEDLFDFRTDVFNSYNSSIIEVSPQYSPFYRKDIFNILGISLIIIFGIVLLTNVLTSLIRKGGLLSGLF